jgi:hypothetical protein
MAPKLMKLAAMTNTDFDGTIDISLDDLDQVCGGAITRAQWAQVKTQAGPYCPHTVQQYGGLNPARINKALATKIGNACVAEMPWYAKGSGRSQFDAALAKAFPQK